MFESRQRQRKRAQRRFFIRVVGGLFILTFALWVFGFIRFIAAMPQPDHSQNTPSSRAAVVLTGGALRVTHGLKLLTTGQIDRLLISGVHVDFSPRSLLALGQRADLGLGLETAIDCCVTLGYAAHDTIGNAKETAQWNALYGIKSLHLVTAQYHMARALLEFHNAMPGVSILANPVFPPDVKQRHWYRWPGTLFLFAEEYSKLQLARLRIQVQSFF